ncbi:hypothetical protein CKF54_05615 [Psittacicella hinzii]|uniref:Uncharacterized protein n=1 Tax=Psittacicella hinzii TaxID=2028575 RepID=A0A3A1Y7F6_9GAMM|nr:hypothetical protein [Psittacicella hinzii]RIY32067.1 hypothetical protein CKF54_05615 [Psittacicella hinzii]
MTTTKRQSTAANKRLQQLAEKLSTDYPFLPFQLELQENYDLCTQEGKIQLITDIEAYNQKVMAYLIDNIEIIKSTYDDFIKALSKEASNIYTILVLVGIREEETIDELERNIYDREIIRNYGGTITRFKRHMGKYSTYLEDSPPFTSTLVHMDLETTRRGIYALEGEFEPLFTEFVKEYHKYAKRVKKYTEQAIWLHEDVLELEVDLILEMDYYGEEEVHEIHDHLASELTDMYNSWMKIKELLEEPYQENKPGILAMKTNEVLGDLKSFIKSVKKSAIIDDALIKQVIGEKTE